MTITTESETDFTRKLVPSQRAAHEAHVARQARMAKPRQIVRAQPQLTAPEAPELVRCPCCKTKVPSLGIDGLRYLDMPPLMQRTLEVLIDTFPRAKSRAQLAAMVYDDNPNGGPAQAESAISVYMSRMRPKLHAVGWTVGWDAAAHGIRLQRLRPKAAA